jgi:hypothetical protein
MMNLHYGDARNKNNSSGQNKLNKFTSNTYASSLINSTSSSPTLNSSLNSNTIVTQRQDSNVTQSHRDKTGCVANVPNT